MIKAEHKVLGIDVGSSSIKSGWVLKGEISDFKKTPINPDVVVSELLDVIATYELESDSIIGVGFPGFVNDGIVHNPPNLPSVKELDLQKKLREEAHCKAYVFNDADAYIFGEALFGAGRGTRIIMGLTLGTGIGGGLVKDGGVYTGSRGYASEYGHMVLDPNGPLCHCGKKGCLEAFIGSYGIIGLYESLSGKKRDVKDIFDKAKNGDSDAIKTLNEFGFYLGIGIRNLVEVFDPDIFVLGGGISRAGDIILDLIKSNRPTYALPFEDVKIVLGRLPDKAGVIGAAYWAKTKHQK